jgi:tRNA pseudouridine(55) synthase
LLILLLGGATRLSNLIMLMPKTYSAVVKLGTETSTCDYTGETVGSGDWSGVSEADIDRAMLSFLGWRLQTPPKVSAVHVRGRRAHELFRKGGDPNLGPKAVFIESARRGSAISGDGEFSIAVKCGKGTYIRSLASDLGRALGCGAHIAALRRERVGYFSLSRSLDPGVDFSVSREKLLSSVMPVSTMENFLPGYAVSDEDASLMSNGRAVPLSRAVRRTHGESSPRGMAVITSGSLLSVARLEALGGNASLTPEVNIQMPGTPEPDPAEAPGGGNAV